MCKIALNNERTTNLLAQCCNTITIVQLFPRRWLKTTQLMEANLQLTMMMVNKVNVETDEIVSKSNYFSIPECSIEYAILKKRLIFDNNLVTENHDIHTMECLKACYDRQLSKIGSIVQESTGVETKPIELVTKMLPIMEYYVRTTFCVIK